MRERVAHPQIVATSRHITGGGVDLLDVQWREGSLIGRSNVVARDPYDIYVTEPAGFTFDKATCDGAQLTGAARDGALVKITCLAETSRGIGWSVTFRR